MPVLRIQGLHFSFRQETVFRDLNMHCACGDVTSLLGASGCGKSTLLRLIAGLKLPASGSIAFGPGNGTSRSEELRLGFVFQKPTLLPWLTALENVSLPLKLAGYARSDRRQMVTEALESVGLRWADSTKLPAELSGGMQMRVSLARAFVTNPSVMLMDEPFSALDEVLRQQLCETTLRLCQREQWTTVFVTHNVAEAVFVSQRILILAGKPATVVDEFEVPFQDRTPSLRASPEFLSLVARVGQRLRAVVELGETVGLSEESGAMS